MKVSSLSLCSCWGSDNTHSTTTSDAAKFKVLKLSAGDRCCCSLSFSLFLSLLLTHRERTVRSCWAAQRLPMLSVVWTQFVPRRAGSPPPYWPPPAANHSGEPRLLSCLSRAGLEWAGWAEDKGGGGRRIDRHQRKEEEGESDFIWTIGLPPGRLLSLCLLFSSIPCLGAAQTTLPGSRDRTAGPRIGWSVGWGSGETGDKIPPPPPPHYHTYYLLLKSERGKGRDFEKVKIKGSCIEVMAATTFNYWQILMMIMHRVRCESGGDWGGCCLTLGPPAGLPPQDHCVSQNQSMPKYKHSLLNKAV